MTGISDLYKKCSKCDKIMTPDRRKEIIKKINAVSRTAEDSSHLRAQIIAFISIYNGNTGKIEDYPGGYKKILMGVYYPESELPDDLLNALNELIESEKRG
jgi:hypothetical protein